MRWVSTDFSKVAKIVPEKPKEVICVGCKLKNDHAEPNRPNGVYVCYDCRETDRDPDHLKEGPKGVSAGRNFIQFFGHDSFGGASSWGDP